MKKAYVVFVFVAVILVLFFAVVLGFKRVNIQDITSGNLIFTANDVTITANLSTEDSEIISDLFNNSWCSKDNPSCGFSEDFQIILYCGGTQQVFYIAQDECGIIYWKNQKRYFGLTNRENYKLRKLLITNYGCNCHIEDE